MNLGLDQAARWADRRPGEDSLPAGRPAAVVFDCDGVLVDTEPLWGQAEQELYARRGVVYTDDDRELLLGRSIPSSAAQLAVRFGEPGRNERIAAELVDVAVELLSARAVVMPGVMELLDRLAAADIPVGVASNSPARAVRASLGGNGLLNRFTVIVTADDVNSPKPDPEPYLQACARLGVAAQGAVAIEDSHTGLRAALAAGMATIGVPPNPGSFPADLVVPDLAHPAVARWVGTW